MFSTMYNLDMQTKGNFPISKAIVSDAYNGHYLTQCNGSMNTNSINLQELSNLGHKDQKEIDKESQYMTIWHLVWGSLHNIHFSPCVFNGIWQSNTQAISEAITWEEYNAHYLTQCTMSTNHNCN